MLDIPLALSASTWAAAAAVLVAVALVFSAAARQVVRVVLRILAHPLLLLAVVALVYDGTRTLAGGSGLVVTSMAEHWQALAPASLTAFRASRVGAAAWDPIIVSVLQLPAWLLLGGLGLALAYIGRKRRAVNVFAN